MQLHEIENLDITALKSDKAALIAAASKAPVDELAARYVQARTDAAGRDAKLAEQGTTITSLHEALQAARQHNAEAVRKLDALNVQLAEQLTTIDDQAKQIAFLKLTLDKGIKRTESAENLARSRRVALATASKILTDALVDNEA